MTKIAYLTINYLFTYLYLLFFTDCPNCVDEPATISTPNKWTMPLSKLGEKRYYLGVFFKVNSILSFLFLLKSDNDYSENKFSFSLFLV